MTRQCTTCGLRFDKTGASDARMAAHLDWHFRMNKRDQERAQRVEIRDWFVPLDVRFPGQSHTVIGIFCSLFT